MTSNIYLLQLSQPDVEEVLAFSKWIIIEMKSYFKNKTTNWINPMWQFSISWVMLGWFFGFFVCFFCPSLTCVSPSPPAISNGNSLLPVSNSSSVITSCLFLTLWGLFILRIMSIEEYQFVSFVFWKLFGKMVGFACSLFFSMLRRISSSWIRWFGMNQCFLFLFFFLFFVFVDEGLMGRSMMFYE